MGLASNISSIVHSFCGPVWVQETVPLAASSLTIEVSAEPPEDLPELAALGSPWAHLNPPRPAARINSADIGALFISLPANALVIATDYFNEQCPPTRKTLI
jgi:hypothetical protein